MLLPFTQSPFLKLVISSFLHSSHVISLSFLSYFWKVRGIGPLVLRTNISPTGFGNSMILKLPSSQLERQLSIQHEHRSWSTFTCTSLHLSFVYKTHHFSLWPTRSILSFLLLLLLLSHFSRVRLCATPRTAAYQAPPSMGFSGQEYWSGVPLPSPSKLLRRAHRVSFNFCRSPRIKILRKEIFLKICSHSNGYYFTYHGILLAPWYDWQRLLSGKTLGFICPDSSK